MIRTYSPQKCIGITLMIVASVGVAPILLLCLLVLLPFFATPVGVMVAAAASFALVCRLCRWRPSFRLIVLLFLGGSACVVFYERFCTAEGVLAHYGVQFEKSYGEDSSSQSIQFYADKNGVQIPGPEITGDDLNVEIRGYDEKDSPVIVVTSDDDKSSRVTIKINRKDKTRPEFAIAENTGMSLAYPTSGYHWP